MCYAMPRKNNKNSHCLFVNKSKRKREKNVMNICSRGKGKLGAK